MSTTFLMGDNWQPTVLQLMPFSNNVAANMAPGVPARGRGFAGSRGFPTLAVTRPKGRNDGSKLFRVSSERMPRALPHGCAPERAKSECSSRARNTLVTTERVYTINDVNQRVLAKTPDMSDSVDSSDGLSVTELPPSVKLLPKPSPCTSVDGRYFLPQNGFYRSVTLTPGELDLQKHRDKFSKDTVQTTRNKKYKLNVNQLPRSTTPINDNDPDKLNIKQVIKYLQTKGEGDTTPASQKVLDRRVRTAAASSKVAVREKSDKSDETSTMPPMMQFRREATGVSQSTSNLHPHNIKRRVQRTKMGESVTKSNDCANGSSFRNTREFRLHRFLTMAPNADDFSHVTQSLPLSSAHKRLLITECSKNADVETDSMRNSHSPAPPYLPSRQGERYHKLRYRLPSKRSEQHVIKSTTAAYKHLPGEPKELSAKEGVIRLPSMSDFHDSDNDDRDKWPRNMRSANGSVDSLEVNRVRSSASSSEKDTEPSDSECSNIPIFKKVTINVPRELPIAIREGFHKERSPHDFVRLSLRQEHGLTREKTYMSDLGRARDVRESASTFKFPGMVHKKNTRTDDISVSRHS